VQFGAIRQGEVGVEFQATFFEASKYSDDFAFGKKF